VQALIRSWNVFHGNTIPSSRHGHLEEMIVLATRDRPAILCLQEVPVWALPELERWSGMQAHSLVARKARRPSAPAAAVTRLHNGFFRSRLAGQANAVLVDRSLTSRALGGSQISDDGRERRIVHAVHVGAVGVVANLHASNAAPAVVLPELERARAFLDRLALPGEPRILAGDFNVAHPSLPGYVNGGPGIDHILVAGAGAGSLSVWPPERRRSNARMLSDHAPVERRIAIS
jgi:endonuclease/exonuclease/phosphatase family metal-dependent hydrolase